ncbi:hypothetical protein IFM89_036875 [Coptis chinensis]|uniref:Uncharacterized protein n=1 Tax=Coptis chinensis TaxID=261450 RepID=A0A835I1T5_9MAGN|nr:hypothetical protein IFM89_036875 [Coptis chinensis]
MEAIKSEDDNNNIQAIQQVIAKKKSDKRNKPDDDDDDDDDDDELLLSKLLSQLESLKEDDTNILRVPPAEIKEPSSAAVRVANETSAGSSGESKEIQTENILSELRKVKRQNSITHWLLSVLIILTAACQYSEVSLIMKVKNNLTHPFRSVGNMITNAQDALKHFDGHEPFDASKQAQIASPSVPALKIPDLPNMDLPVLDLNGGEK